MHTQKCLPLSREIHSMAGEKKENLYANVLLLKLCLYFKKAERPELLRISMYFLSKISKC